MSLSEITRILTLVAFPATPSLVLSYHTPYLHQTLLTPDTIGVYRPSKKEKNAAAMACICAAYESSSLKNQRVDSQVRLSLCVLPIHTAIPPTDTACAYLSGAAVVAGAV